MLIECTHGDRCRLLLIKQDPISSTHAAELAAMCIGRVDRLRHPTELILLLSTRSSRTARIQRDRMMLFYLRRVSLVSRISSFVLYARKIRRDEPLQTCHFTHNDGTDILEGGMHAYRREASADACGRLSGKCRYQNAFKHTGPVDTSGPRPLTHTAQASGLWLPQYSRSDKCAPNGLQGCATHRM